MPRGESVAFLRSKRREKRGEDGNGATMTDERSPLLSWVYRASPSLRSEWWYSRERRVRQLVARSISPACDWAPHCHELTWIALRPQLGGPAWKESNRTEWSAIPLRPEQLQVTLRRTAFVFLFLFVHILENVLQLSVSGRDSSGVASGTSDGSTIFYGDGQFIAQSVALHTTTI